MTQPTPRSPKIGRNRCTPDSHPTRPTNRPPSTPTPRPPPPGHPAHRPSNHALPQRRTPEDPRTRHRPPGPAPLVPEKFGAPCPPHDSVECAIDSFASTTCCRGVRLEADGRWRVDAPHGLSDVFNLVVRPNPVLAPRDMYEAKAERWRREWLELRVLEWPAQRREGLAPSTNRKNG
ncbi:nucleotidyltransferase family protein [Streptomyces sp. NPDC001530]|uniref:nucleotidyltransferase family protein n=1 Tax=Streptomyces sp. NPDC001530 TaxID=3364582 RepID=UPI003688F268